LNLPPISLVTGVSAADEIKAFADRLAAKCGLDLYVHVVKNRFFSGFVTVAGLLTGQDLIEQLSDEPLGEYLLVPDVMLREGHELFLDDVSIDDLSDRLGVEVEVVPADPWGVWDMLDTLAMEQNSRDE
jgi:NifB/MoaA-like Fe-S oxidoreductase